MSKVIEVTISPEGESRIETKGFTGESCREATKSLEQALGLGQAEQLTAEFHLAAIRPSNNPKLTNALFSVG